SLRKGLVTLQFAISQFLIIGTLIVSSQTDFFLNKDLGFQTKAILSSYVPERDAVKLERFRQMMLSSPAIESVSFSLSEHTGNSNSKSNFNYAPLESPKAYHGNFKAVDPHYISLFEIELLAGRDIREGDSTNVVINQKVADLMGFKDRYDQAVGETLSTGWGGDKKVVGVVKDFHAYSLAEDLDYILFIHAPHMFYTLSFKTTSPAAITEAKAHFEQTWEHIFPQYVREYDFYDKTLAEEYEDVMKITALMKVFAGISILIGCLGLYGLISFIAMNKTKEIGVRKVLGASVFSILSMFSREVIILMTIAFSITTPLAFYFLSEWLNTFAFSISIGPGFFIVSFVVTMLIAIVTISHKTISTALINPAETLKDD
ncbi:MAG: FtsX-like permease family protein, partial [Marinoscillum sp.]|uniref:ABC transporter permease n=1 Tax=Marinoscillum sp. TaxID=2024838 RepID=UPI0033037C2F